MKLYISFIIVALLGYVISSPLQCSDQVKSSKEEKEKKKEKKKTTVITNDNIDSLVTDKTYNFVHIHKDDNKNKGVKKDKKKTVQSTSLDLIFGSSTEEQEKKKYWRNQKVQLEADLRQTQADIKSLKMERNSLHTEYLNTDLPYREQRIRETLQKIDAKIEKKEALLKKHETRLEDLADRARKAGVPPGWIR